jgi:hypothetical protein
MAANSENKAKHAAEGRQSARGNGLKILTAVQNRTSDVQE